jgi:glycerol-3-phosphate acyltransferase PlsY
MGYEPGTILVVSVISYLLGSISFSRLVAAYLTPGEDISGAEIQFVGSSETLQVGHIGGNVVAQEFGARWGMLVSLLDIAKIALPSLVCKLIYPELPYYVLLVGIAGMAGHNWPIYYRFHGGMGFSPAMGSLLVVDWLSIIVLPIAGTLLGLIVRNMVVASLSWLWLLVPWMWFRTQDWVYVGYAISLNLLFLLAMIPEIKRALSYWREGKLEEYGESMLKSNPMGRGLIRMAEKFNNPSSSKINK